MDVVVVCCLLNSLGTGVPGSWGLHAGSHLGIGVIIQSFSSENDAYSQEDLCVQTPCFWGFGHDKVSLSG